MNRVELFSRMRFLLTELKRGRDTCPALLNLLMETDPDSPETALAVQYAVQHLQSLWEQWKESSAWVLYHYQFEHRTKKNPSLVPLAACFWLSFHLDAFVERVDSDAPVLGHLRALSLTPDFMNPIRKERDRMLEALTHPLIARRLPELVRLKLESWQIGVAITRQILASPLIPSLKTLSLAGNNLGIGGCKALAECRALDGLESLKLRGCQIDHKRTRALLSKGGFPQVKTLDLSHNLLDFQAAREFVGTNAFAALESLDLNGNQLVPQDIRLLSEVRSFRKLHTLNLDYNVVGNEGLEGLANLLPALETLRVSTASVLDKGCLLLAEGEGVSRLKCLEANNNKVGFEGFCHLLESTQLNGLRHLSLSHNQIGSGAERKPGFHGLPALRSLDLAHNQLNKHAVRVLVEGRSWEHLETLSLSNNRIAVRDSRLLFSEGKFPVLKKLSLGRNLLRSSAVSLLLESEGFPLLRELDLSHNLLDKRAAAELAGGALLPQLTSLSMTGSKLGREGVEVLLGSQKMQRLERLELSSCQMGFYACRRFVEAELPSLKHLVIQDNGLGDGSLRALLKAPWIQQLETLDIRNNRIDYGVIQQARKELTQLKNFFYGRVYSFYQFR